MLTKILQWFGISRRTTTKPFDTETAAKPATPMELLQRAEDRAQELANWIKENRKLRDKKAEELHSKAVTAFKHFKPSSVPPSVRDKDSYLEDRGKLKETLQRVRTKAFTQLEKKRRPVPNEMASKLGLSDEGGKVKFEDVAKLLRTRRGSAETRLNSALSVAQKHTTREDQIVEKLYQYLAGKS